MLPSYRRLSCIYLLGGQNARLQHSAHFLVISLLHFVMLRDHDRGVERKNPQLSILRPLQVKAGHTEKWYGYYQRALRSLLGFLRRYSLQF